MPLNRRAALKTALGGGVASALSSAIAGSAGGDRTQMLLRRVSGPPAREISFDRARLMTESLRHTEGEPVVVRRAKVFAAIVDQIPIAIHEGELLVGNTTLRPRVVYFAPDQFDWIRYQPGKEHLLESRHFAKELAIRYRIPADIESYWKGKPSGVSAGHFVADYARVLRSGFSGIRREIGECRGRLRRDGRLDGGRAHFFEAEEIVCEAAENFGHRYARLARSMAASEPDSVRRSELEEVARVCTQVPARPARTFREALQSFWFAHLMLLHNSPDWSISPGRLDQYMWPYYRGDVAAGRLSRAEAADLLALLWIKFNEVRMGALDFIVYQNLVIGGVDGEGGDVTNELTHLCLETTGRFKLIQPSLSLRCHSGTPRDVLEKACRVVLAGTGFPAIFNDAISIPAVRAAGVSLADARDYAFAGCTELTVPSKLYARVRLGGVNQAQCLLDSLFRLSGQHAPRDFNDVMAAYRAEVRRATRTAIRSIGEKTAAAEKLTPHPYPSLLFDYCLREGLDVTQGGAQYNWHWVGEAGTITAANSLLAVKKAVFDDRVVTFGQLMEAVRSNFETNPKLRAFLFHRVPKFGNDIDEIDGLCRELADLNSSALAEAGSLSGMGWCVTGSVTYNWTSGHAMGATPDGRLRGDGLSVNLGPAAGTDQRGPTAMLNSVAGLDWKKQALGGVTHLKLPYTGTQNAAGVDTLCALIRAFFQRGGMGLHFTVVDAAMLREALKNPEQHMDLMVRVGGFSAPFVLLSPDIQRNIIERTEHDL